MYAVIYPGSAHYGEVLSRHRTRENAERAVKREAAAFARSPHGKHGGWLERLVVPCERGATRVWLD